MRYIDLFFEVIIQKRGGYTARCLNYNCSINLRADNLQGLHDGIISAIDAHFVNGKKPDPSSIRLFIYRE